MDRRVTDPAPAPNGTPRTPLKRNPSYDVLGFNYARAMQLAADSSHLGFATRRLVGGINFVQFLEFRLAIEHLDLRGGERLLDIASPKLLAAYLAATGQVAEIHMTDLSDPRLEEFRELVPERRRDRVFTRFVDASELDRAYPEDSFDKVYSLTSFQHFEGDKDIRAMGQVARVLHPGGLFFVTVPYGPALAEEKWTAEGTRKRYDERSIAERLAHPDLKLVKRIYYGERWLPIDRVLSQPTLALNGLMNWMSPALQPLFWVERPPEKARGVALLYQRC